MLKQLNRVLKLVGLNLVRAKRKKSIRPQYKVFPDVPLSDYTGDAEWNWDANVAVGYKAKVQVVDLDAAFVPVDTDERPRVEQPNSDNKTSGPTS